MSKLDARLPGYSLQGPTFWGGLQASILTAGWFWAGLLLAAGTGAYNIGIIALDDYSNEISTMIPAQHQVPWQTWINEGVHPPYARLALSAVTRVFYAMQVTDPVTQLRLCLLLLGVACFTVTAWSLCRLLDGVSPQVRGIGFFLAGFYFLAPLIYSRPMVESLSIPFLTGSCALAHAYWRTERVRMLVLSLVVLAAGCLLRPQIGSCAVAIFLLPVLKMRYRHLAVLFAAGIACIVLTGLADVALGKGFHGSLRSYAEYNQYAGSWHGSMPFYTFLLFFLGLSLPPALISRYRGFSWRAEYAPLFVVLSFFGCFVVAHSFFPHKEERFMIPAIPLFAILLGPMLGHLSRTGRMWRVRYFHALNATLLVLVITQIPQSNAIGLVRALEQTPQIKKVVSLEDSIVLFPTAYGLRVKDLERTSISQTELLQARHWPCDTALVVREDKSRTFDEYELPFRKAEVFRPGLLERLVVRTNPNRNLRRAALEIWLADHCANPFGG